MLMSFCSVDLCESSDLLRVFFFLKKILHLGVIALRNVAIHGCLGRAIGGFG